MLWFVVVFAVVQAKPVSAHVGATTYLAYGFPAGLEPDIRDGSFADWESQGERLVPPVTKNSFEPLNTVADFGISDVDVDFNWFFGWSPSLGRLYFMAEVLDDIYLRPTSLPEDELSFYYDSLEIMVDGDHAGEQYSDFASDSLRSGVTAQHYMLFPGHDGRARISMFPKGEGLATRPPYADVNGHISRPANEVGGLGGRTRYVIEGYITPWDSLAWDHPEQSRPSLLSAGSVIGMQLSVSDCDTEPGACHGYYTLYGMPNAWRYAGTFIDLELLAPPSPTVLGEDSWGRIKASFGVEGATRRAHQTLD